MNAKFKNAQIKIEKQTRRLLRTGKPRQARNHLIQSLEASYHVPITNENGKTMIKRIPDHAKRLAAALKVLQLADHGKEGS